MTIVRTIGFLVWASWLGIQDVEAAALKPAGVFGDHMVLQRGMAVPVWGRAGAGAAVTVEFAGQSVGVKADLRSYEHPVLLVGDDPGWETLEEIATSLTKRVAGINRCLFELGGRAPREAELVPATVTRERLDLLRELDAIVMGALERHDLMTTIWQCPTVLVPLRLDGAGSELVVIRPVLSERKTSPSLSS